MLSPDAFEDEYPPTKLDVELPDRAIASLRDVQYLYGTLYTLATAGAGEYAAFLTPDHARDLVDEPESLIVLRVDLSGDNPTLASDARGPVWITSYSEDLVRKVAHCKYHAPRGIDHSITHRSGHDSSLRTLIRYATERLTKWPTDEVVRSVADDHEDGWIIDALAELGSHETNLAFIEESLVTNLGGPTTALVTVQVKLESGAEYLWPDDIDVFNEAMKARRLAKLTSKGTATGSMGTATDALTGDHTRLVGTAEDPLNYFLGKQLETFPAFDPDVAWRTHPISEEAAITIQNAEPFIEACKYATFGMTVYYLPYFTGKPTPAHAYELYHILYAAHVASEQGKAMTAIERAYEQLGNRIDEYGPRLRFYVALVRKHHAKRYDVFGETLTGSINYPVEVARAHEDLLETWAFHKLPGSGRTPPMPTHERWGLLSRSGHRGYLRAVSTGAYFLQTFPDSTGRSAASVDDPRIRALVSVISGDPIRVETLLRTYVTRLIDEEGERFPFFEVASQFAQLCALALADVDIDLLVTDTETMSPITEPPTYDIPNMHPTDTASNARADGGPAVQSPAQKLEQFIDQTPALREHGERRGAFLLGALVGEIANYQEWHEQRSTTLVDQYPIKSLTKQRLKKATQEAIDKTLAYTRQEKRKHGSTWRGTKFDWIIDRLRTAILNPDPDDAWRLDTDDLRFYYALGVAYGMNDRRDRAGETTTTDSE